MSPMLQGLVIGYVLGVCSMAIAFLIGTELQKRCEASSTPVEPEPQLEIRDETQPEGETFERSAEWWASRGAGRQS